MADSSYEKGLTELAKMKVADLRAELKQRGLSITGNKNELVERLQLAIHDSSLSLDEANDEILDEDAVLGDEEIEETEELSTKIVPPEECDKRKSNDENNIGTKKIILNRKNIIEEVKIDIVENKEAANDKTLESEPEKKVIKLSELNTNERLEMRAKKFGVILSENAKKEARAARFKMASNNTANLINTKSAASIKSTPVHTTYDVLKKRAERFGSNVSSLMEKAELEDKIEKRKARFGEVKAIDKVVPTKIKLVK
ncbi:PREDICTED: SAP domain-containing ribonucleoprotein [Ceratosolen solmsi marchali]|uniref:SAP domain-containing ribonucleoprotein n=1 Tax=Ceratosolen solmsi marchali TaxID=326594 RepID=A0AAJ6YC03_9HYME|nr:PREDICTED: SAP domain-containing ribonucleoprotein [Ceratosolen solmsi marchali]